MVDMLDSPVADEVKIGGVEEYRPDKMQSPYFRPDSVQIPPPLQKEPPKPTPIAHQLIRAAGALMIAYMTYYTYTHSGRSGSGMAISPQRLMYPLMMVVGIFAGMNSHANGADDEKEKRAKHMMQYQACDLDIWDQQKKIFDFFTERFPSPHVLPSYIENASRVRWGTKNSTMWQTVANNDQFYNPNMQGMSEKYVGEHDGKMIPVTEKFADQQNTFSTQTYLSARIGVGSIRLSPRLEINELPPLETLEAATTFAMHRLVKMQSFIPGIPSALRFTPGTPTIFYSEDEDMLLDVIRSVIVSLAYTHSPKVLRLGVITPKINAETWKWMMWLPHIKGDTIDSLELPRNLAWESMRDCVDNYQLDSTADIPIIVVVDTPNSIVTFPEQFCNENTNMIFVVARNAGVNASRCRKFTVTPEGYLIYGGLDDDD